MEKKVCPECGTPLHGVNDCKEYFDRMLAWDFTDFATVGRNHHLTVLCYYLQHPSHYSTEGLKKAVQILTKVIEEKVSDKELYQEESSIFSSSKRTWSVRSTPTNRGKYSQKIKWSVTVAEVVQDGISKYPERVTEWANSIYNDLKDAQFNVGSTSEEKNSIEPLRSF